MLFCLLLGFAAMSMAQEQGATTQKSKCGSQDCQTVMKLKKEYIYQAAMLDPHTAAELSIDKIITMCDDLIKAHGKMLPKYK